MISTLLEWNLYIGIVCPQCAEYSGIKKLKLRLEWENRPLFSMSIFFSLLVCPSPRAAQTLGHFSIPFPASPSVSNPIITSSNSVHKNNC